MDYRITSKQADCFYNRIKGQLSTLSQYPFNTRRISNPQDILLAVNEVYQKPFTLRTIKGHNENIKKSTENVRKILADNFSSYFNQTPFLNQNDFDKWHDEQCNFFCREYNIKSGLEIKYGRAQKEVNMVFKYLACYGDYNDKEEYFKFCHMPIDRDVLKKLQEFGIDGVMNQKYDNVSWSNLSGKQYIELKNKYLYYFSNESKYMNISALKIEFDLW